MFESKDIENWLFLLFFAFLTYFYELYGLSLILPFIEATLFAARDHLSVVI